MRRYGACLMTTTLDANIGEKPCSLENKSFSSPPNAGPQRPEMGLNQRATSQLAQGGAPGLAAAWHLPSCAAATSVVAGPAAGDQEPWRASAAARTKPWPQSRSTERSRSCPPGRSRRPRAWQSRDARWAGPRRWLHS